MLKLQQLTGLLTFLGNAIYPASAFTHPVVHELFKEGNEATLACKLDAEM